MAKSRTGSERRRVFSAEFKLETIRRADERRAAGVPLTQIAGELGVTDDLLRSWRRQLAARDGAPAGDVFPGQGRLPSDEAEVRRLQRELARAQQEIAFQHSAVHRRSRGRYGAPRVHRVVGPRLPSAHAATMAAPAIPAPNPTRPHRRPALRMPHPACVREGHPAMVA